MRSDLAADFESIDSRKHYVQEDEPIFLTQNHGEALLPRTGRVHFDRELAQHVLEQEGVDTAIINDQDRFRVHGPQGMSWADPSNNYPFCFTFKIIKVTSSLLKRSS